MRRIIFTIIFIALSALFSLPSLATSIDKIVVFGDSLSDNGNVSHIFKGKIPRNPPYFSGRFSDGVIWIEMVADKLRLNSADQFSDHAFAGAWGSDENESDPLSYFTLSSEIDDYISFEYKDKASETNHLYVIWIGNNDYLAGNPSLDINTATDKTVNAILSGMDTLIEHGATHFLILNITDLGQTPHSVKAGTEIASRRTQLSIAHNAKLAEKLQEKRLSNPNLYIVEVNLMPYFTDLVEHPEKHQLKIVDKPCYDGDYGTLDDPVQNVKMKNTKYDLKYNSLLKNSYDNHHPIAVQNWNRCQNPDEYIYWDHLHPTTAVHRMLADYVLEVLEKNNIHG
jgi:phospholipase/lecithinase/hemolysin